MYRKNLVLSPNCRLCGISEDIDHFLLGCYRYYSLRCLLKARLHSLGITDISVEVLLGGGNYSLSLKEKVARAIMSYVSKSGRLGEL